MAVLEKAAILALSATMISALFMFMLSIMVYDNNDNRIDSYQRKLSTYDLVVESLIVPATETGNGSSADSNDDDEDDDEEKQEEDDDIKLPFRGSNNNNNNKKSRVTIDMSLFQQKNNNNNRKNQYNDDNDKTQYSIGNNDDDNEIEHYVNGEICIQCRHMLYNGKRRARCMDEIYHQVRKMNKNKNNKNNKDKIGNSTIAGSTLSSEEEVFSTAGIRASENYPVGCSSCHPENCTHFDKRYYRVDTVAPKVIYGQTHYLKSIGPERRLPRNAIHDLHTYIANENNTLPKKDHFFEFNPSIAKLPTSQIPNYAPDAVYISAYRVSNIDNCVEDYDIFPYISGGRTKKQPNGKKLGRPIDLLGIGLIRADLTLIVDVVIRVKNMIYQDPRIHVLNDQLYLSSFNHLRQFSLKECITTENDNNNNNNAIACEPADKVWASPIDISFSKTVSCSRSYDIQRFGKNLNYFTDLNGQIILQYLPHRAHEIIDPTKSCIVLGKNATASDSIIKSEIGIPIPTFSTREEMDMEKAGILHDIYTTDRGSACCVRVQHPYDDGRDLLLGISHSKTKYKPDIKNPAYTSNQYFSSFYVRDGQPPYDVIARTGRFCLGDDTNADTDGETTTTSDTDNTNNNPYITLPHKRLIIADVEYNCPKIHFVSGMIEKYNDPTKLILSYGINDCMPRFIIINKSDVIQMLFPTTTTVTNTETNTMETKTKTTTTVTETETESVLSSLSRIIQSSTSTE